MDIYSNVWDNIKQGMYQNREIGDEGRSEAMNVPIGPSSAIQSVQYDPADNRADVTFVNGKHPYSYDADPEQIDELVNAPSKGRLISTQWNHNPEMYYTTY